MRRILSHIALIAALAALVLSVGSVAVADALGEAAPGGASPSGNAALNKQVQEALAKAQAQKGAGGAAGVPGSAGGSEGSFSKLTEKGGEEQATTPTKTTSGAPSSSGSLSMGVILPILIVGGGLLAGIAFLIVRDARSVTPAGDLLASVGSAEARAARLRKRRAKAKAARRQRKRNR